MAFYRSPNRHLYYYDSYIMPLRHYFKHWPVTRVQQADVTDREQQSVHLGDPVEEKNCGALALSTHITRRVYYYYTIICTHIYIYPPY